MSTGAQDRILTIPNGLTLLRALGIPLFLWVYFAFDAPVLSFFILAVGAATDYLDGKVARALNQESKLGAMMDPAIDRAYIASTVIALAISNVIPWWIVGILMVRDLWMSFALAVKKKRTGQVFVVSYLGKAATFNLLYAFPLFLLGGSQGVSQIFHVLAWAFVIWGIGLYLFTAVQYSSDAFKREAKNVKHS